MEIVLDACAYINLYHGGCLEKILASPDDQFYIGEATLQHEMLDEVQRIVLDALITTGKISVISSNASLAQILTIQATYGIGLGESECIALCVNSGFAMCTDDKRARVSAEHVIGRNNILGSLRILKLAVSQLLIHCEEALTSYSLMLQKGGFLPSSLNSSYFCT